MTTIVSLAADGSNASTGSKTTLDPAKKSDNTIIVNVNQDLRNVDKTIKSLETTLEKNFQQLIRVVNASFRRKRPDGPGNMCWIML